VAWLGELDSSLGDLDSSLKEVASFELGAPNSSLEEVASFELGAPIVLGTRATHSHTARPQADPTAARHGLAPPPGSVRSPANLGASLLELGLSVGEIERLTPLAARFSSQQILSAAQAILSSRPPDVPVTRSSSPPRAAARSRDTVRPPVRRLRSTQRPGLRHASEPARPPTLRVLEPRRFTSKPSIVSPTVSARRSAATAASPTTPSSTELTCCTGCSAVTPTLRASTLSSIGWRLESSSGHPGEHGQRWVCPKCRAQLAATSIPSAIAARKA
jgi:hypothetical protein